ncbi:MAG: glycoside hydrolase family 3 domain protein [Hydrocarboniphaga sp.]|uniref:glycoside hydrolase family 3 N-terminal domain-containing protein n=1 Tax=Hydrocarboniphaga sp. TaxID=2033016 RepID=UPI00261C26AF|nr:glycoside hydrolase family 3 N-terminal domain-containing protein [Hydrocarboniphaga sp.]MDB5971253.1 glycoside hydrolase family 3 domain protein [Hydrocarboniphaga sp.]
MSRIEKLLSQMTLAEKLGQLTMTASGYAVTGPIIAGDSTESIKDGTIGNLLNIIGPGPTREVQQIAVEQTRLGIPLLIGLDIIHGHRTLFPIPLAEAALFDDAAWELSAREAAREGASDGLSMTFAPMLDVSRDPRWGRTAEGSGEDPYLTSRMARAKVRGFQGSSLSSADAIAACAKHFCAYGPVTAGREYASVDISERTLHEVHLPPFVAAVAAGVATIMPAFTDLAGIPMTAHKALLRDYLRDQLGFDGVLVSDYNAIGELMRHGVAADLADAAALALKAGVDIDMMADGYRKGLPIALERGTVTMDDIDVCVRRVLKLKEDLGLFDDPYRRGASAEAPEVLIERRQLARRIGARAITMLKNERDTLPLSPTVKRLSVIGPLADAGPEMRGCWWSAGENEPHVGVLAGIRKGFPNTEIRHAPGTAINSADRSGIPAALQLCNDTDAVLLCLGEATAMSGEAASRAYPELPGQQLALAEAVFEHARERGVPVIVVLFSGRPLVIPLLAEKADALLAAWFLGTEAGNAISDVVSGIVSPSGRTPMSWPRALGQVPIFFGQRNSGRPLSQGDSFTSRYLDVPNDPLYPFGHGLSYGSFVYDNLRITPDNASEADVITVRVDVGNHGRHGAEETVFLFTHDKVASVARPLLELKGYGKISLQPGETGTVELLLPASELRFLGIDLKPVFEAGDIEILVGASAERSRLLLGHLQLTD